MASALILYDQDCGFCRWCLAKLLAWDRRGRLTPVPLGTLEADRVLEGMPRDQQMSSWHLLAPDGHLYSAGLGFAPLFRLLPGGAPLAALAARAPRLSERGYRWVADRRSRFGRLLSAGAKRRADRRIAARR